MSPGRGGRPEKRGGGDPNVRWRFYVTAAASEVVRSELQQLDRDSLAAISAAMKRCAAGQLHQGDVSRIDSDIDELRVSLAGNTYRLLFSREGRSDQVLLALTVFQKKTAKTPKAVVKRAQKRLADWRSRGDDRK